MNYGKAVPGKKSWDDMTASTDIIVIGAGIAGADLVGQPAPGRLPGA